MKLKILVASMILITKLILSMDIECKYYLYLEAYEKYKKEKTFDNLKNMLIKGLYVTKEKKQQMNMSTKDIDELIKFVKDSESIDQIKEKYSIIKYKINKINKEFLIYLVQKNNLIDCMKIAGNLNSSDFKTLKSYYLFCIKSKNSNKENKFKNQYHELYIQFTQGNITYLNKTLKNLSNNILKEDILKYINYQIQCNAPVCNLSLHSKIKKELFILLCKNLGGVFEEYLKNKKIYYGCKLNKKPFDDWIEISNDLYRPLDCELEEKDKKLLSRFY